MIFAVALASGAAANDWIDDQAAASGDDNYAIGAFKATAFVSTARGGIAGREGYRKGSKTVVPFAQEPIDEDEDDDDDDDEFSCFFSSSLDGSPLADKLGVLREFRDRFLTPHAPGRWLAKAYYRLSPRIARFVAERESARMASRPAVACVIWLCEVLLKSSETATPADTFPTGAPILIGVCKALETKA
jgi:hypothetical protein